jgi:hypothetical protein
MKRGPGALAGCVVTCLACLAACTDTPPHGSCSNAPPDGCPEDFGADVCLDPSCDAVYACDNGRWTFVRMCSARDVANDVGAAMDGTESVSDSGEAPDVTGGIDAPPGAFGGPGCVPLQTPDCPLGVAASCAPRPDCCGCTDLFVCADGGWDPWGQCVDGSAVPQ